MIRIYGMPTCPYCDYVHEQIAGREDEFEYINIGEHIRCSITARKSEMLVSLPLCLRTAGCPLIRRMPA